MPYQMTVSVTNAVESTDIEADVAEACQEAYEALQSLPSNRKLNLDFPEVKELKSFVKQAKAWCAATIVHIDEETDAEGNVTPARDTPLAFIRKDTSEDIKANPLHLSFRIYLPREPLSEEEKAKRKATREANRQAALAEVEANIADATA